jgi:O-antigen/teichoic acid export membrane protein
MRRHIANAGWGVLDYAAYPAMMFVVAPLVLHRLGAAEYGIWSVTTAVISIGGVIASGFGDANIQRVARLRGHKDLSAASADMVRTVRSLLTIHLALGTLLALIAWCAVPWMAVRLAHAQPAQTRECVVALRLASVLILLRALETVPVSTQRAFEQFGSAVRINTGVRLLTLGTAAVLAVAGRHVVSLLLATAVALTIGTALQYRELCRLLGSPVLRPMLDRASLKTLLHTGLFTWLQALGGVIFSQLDRVVLGVAVGAAAAAPYLLCVQFAHPIAGLTGSALSFLFPHLSMRVTTATRSQLVKTLLQAFLCNLLLVTTGAGLLLFFGERLIRSWAGPLVARGAAELLPCVVVGSALMGLSVTATYALLALGNFRLVAIASMAMRAIMLLAILLLATHHGLLGLAWVRLSYGVLCMLLYVPLWRRLRVHSHVRMLAANLDAALPEGAQS